jgi:hypothetical protein
MPESTTIAALNEVLVVDLAHYTVEGMVAMACVDPSSLHQWCERLIELDRLPVYAAMLATAGRILVNNRYPGLTPDKLGNVNIRYVNVLSGHESHRDDTPPMAVAYAELVGAVLAADGNELYRVTHSLWADRRGLCAELIETLIHDLHRRYHGKETDDD